MKIAIIGTSGQLGFDLARLLPTPAGGNHTILPFSGRAELDITNPVAFTSMLSSQKPDAVINTAAFHNVDLCEKEADAAYRTNVLAVRDMAKACESTHTLFIQIGTDYVMEGDPAPSPTQSPGIAIPATSSLPPRPLPESAPVSPTSIYALTRFGGDSMTLAHAPTTGYVVRSCGLFGIAGCKLKGGLNFIDVMIKLARQALSGTGKPLTVVDDQIVAPTPTDDLALQLAAILQHRLPVGLYHAVSHGQTSWYNFAQTALDLAKIPCQIQPVPSSSYPTPAQRPRYSVLDNAKLRAHNLDLMHPWQDSLARYIAAKYPA